MNFPDNSFSSSSSATKSPSIPTDEPNSKKSTRHFMSPTISAASKANPPRKKILAERNESLDTHLQKTVNLDPKTTLKAASLDSRTTSAAEVGDDQENSLTDDSSSRPCDPLTNYLSPRPEFLRYTPHRRREMFLKRENEIKDCIEEPKKCIDLASSPASSRVGSKEVKVEQEIDDTDDEGLEEVDEERGCWGLGGVLKLVFLMGVLVFSAAYISSMNSPTPSPCVQAVEGVKEGFRMMQHHVYEFVKTLDSEKLFLVDKEGSLLGLVDVEGFKKKERTNDVKIMRYEVEIDDEINEVLVEMKSGEMKTCEFSEGEANEVVDILEHEEKGMVEDEVSKVTELLSEDVSLEKFHNLEIAKTDEVSNLEMAKAEEFLLDQVATTSEFQELEVVELLQSIMSAPSFADAVEKEDEIMDESIQEQIFDLEIAGTEIVSDEAELTPNKRNVIIKHIEENQSILISVMGISVLFSTIASLVYVFRSRKNINSTQISGAILEPCLDTLTAKKCNSQLADREDMHIQHPVSPAKSNSMMSSVEEDVRLTPESRAPKVELLGELVVVEMSSPSISIKANSIPIHFQPASYSDISSIHSSHTIDNFLKKEEERDEEGEEEEAVKKKAAAPLTPLRRSSRLRNRVTSP